MLAIPRPPTIGNSNAAVSTPANRHNSAILRRVGLAGGYSSDTPHTLGAATRDCPRRGCPVSQRRRRRRRSIAPRLAAARPIANGIRAANPAPEPACGAAYAPAAGPAATGGCGRTGGAVLGEAFAPACAGAFFAAPFAAPLVAPLVAGAFLAVVPVLAAAFFGAAFLIGAFFTGAFFAGAFFGVAGGIASALPSCWSAGSAM